MRISFLIHNAYGIGGTIRTTCNLAGKLSERHDVEIVSVFRHLDEPQFVYDPRVRLRHLVDLRQDSQDSDLDDPRRAVPATVFPASDRRHDHYSALTDERIARHLAQLDADVVVGTRPGLNVHIARQAPRTMVRVAQEHLTLDTHSTKLVLLLRRLYPRLDAVVTTTAADAAAYRRRIPGVRVTPVPNSVPASDDDPSPCTEPVVVAAGRLAPAKCYDDLIRAFAKVAAERPDWTLRLYGAGAERKKLAALVVELHAQDAVRLMGPASPLEPELAKASILAVSSSMESFGMTIVEGMRAGLPVVSTDCPLGPREIISDGVDGLLVPPRDIDAMAAALLRLINDDELRVTMGRAASVKGEQYDPDRIARLHETLFQRLLDARARRGGRGRAAVMSAGGQVLGAAYALGDVAMAAGRKARRTLGK
ncbi:glycosyltransferase family 4 protein [Streptomyces sp. So13.3]|uniref:glycosyltransferase n=1 Tax=Streptomyces TaxID=1883 RepID=UPI0011075D88|nr:MULTISPECIES: glycosyltransferase [Streptomyces]MCZ4096598.1 glycosyltransferase [Streptomyces sp. H39-C1]QNA72660.1 glycosyltransferase family 4 protein [Streptomyces sp. So13.3]